jgi:tRNA nucleotidyltransferase (CCA-adding enzyme)
MEVITTHINADFDSLGSMLAAKKLYPDAVVVFPGSQERSLREFFVHSTLYALEVERVKNINLAEVTRLILVDTRQISRIGRFAEIIGRAGLEIHIYDHHPASPDDVHGNVEVLGETGANVTLLLRIVEERGLDLSPEEATAMMLGIYEDTGNLTFSSAREEDFLAAAFLVRKGANLSVLSNIITRELTAEQVFLLNDLIQSATRYEIHGTEVVIAQASVDHYIGDIAVLVHKIMDMENLNVLFILVLMENRVYLIGRSRIEEVNVAEVAGEFGGGGHPTAASATLKGMTVIEANEKLVEVLNASVRPKQAARDVMVYPVKTVKPDWSLGETGDLLARYNLNTLPVVEEGRVIGLISKPMVERAVRHGLNSSPVREFMTTEFTVVSPEAPFSRVRDVIIGQNQGLLPVVEDDGLVGTISVADVMRALQEEMLTSLKGRAALEGQPLYARKKMITQRMQERFPERVRTLLLEFGRVGDQLGYPVYAVGGFVRDLLMGVENFDLDIVVEGDGIQFAEEFEKRFPCRIRTHKKFGTAIILFSDGLKVDVATARLEIYDAPAALPVVEKGSIKMDVYRRDFTINTLAIQLNPAGFGVLIDFFGGVKDIKEKVIRVLHNLSFVEDPTRIFRAIRFEQRLGFQIAKHTQNLMKSSVKMGFMERLSGGRVFSELVLILQEDNPVPALKRMKDFDLLRFLHSRLTFDDEAERLFERIHHVISWFDLLFLEERYDRWLMYLCGLLDFLSAEEAEAVCRRFSMSEKLRNRVLEGRRQAERALLRMFPWANADVQPTHSEVYAVLHPIPTEAKLFMMAKTSQTVSRRYLSLYFTQLRDTTTLLKGIDLIRMGVTPGPSIRKTLDALLKARLDEQVETIEDEKVYVSKLHRMES